MSKILIFAMQEGFGGVEQYVLNLSRYCSVNPIDRYGYVVLGHKTIYEKELERLGVDYFYVTQKRESVLSNIKELRKLLKEQRSVYDTIYFNVSGVYDPVPYLLALKYKYKIVLHSHVTGGLWPKKLFHYMNRWWVSKIASAHLACSTPAGRWLFGRNEFELIPNAVQLDKFMYNEQCRCQIREQYKIPDTAYVVGNVARLTYVKNQSFLLDIMSNMLKRDSAIYLILVGDGEDMPALKVKVETLDMGENIIFAGRTDFPEKYYSAFDCFVLPSFVEGLPISALEAQANGLPCVLADTITDECNITGNVEFLPLDSDINDWAECILKARRSFDTIELLKRRGFDVHESEKRIYSLITGASF